MYQRGPQPTLEASTPDRGPKPAFLTQPAGLQVTAADQKGACGSTPRIFTTGKMIPNKVHDYFEGQGYPGVHIRNKDMHRVS